MKVRTTALGTIVALAAAIVATVATTASAIGYDDWGAPQNLQALGADADLNTTALEGCPAVSRDGLSLYFASNRAGGVGAVDIYISTRDDVGDPWGAPANLGAPVNTTADELCPTPMRDGRGFLFVSSRPGGCGGLDIYATRKHALRGWSQPVDAGCVVNSAADEASPSLVGDELYFSSTRSGGADIYVAPVDDEGSIGTPAAVASVNSSAADARPNIRRDGLEMFFDSNRSGGCGGIDLWTSTRSSTAGSWSQPHNVGCDINSSANDLRAALSWDATVLYFGSNRAGSEGNQDVYATERHRVPANGT